MPRSPRLGPDHPDTLATLNNLAGAYWQTKQLDRSVPLFEDLLKRHEAKFGRQHPSTQFVVANLGVNYKDAGRLKKAIPLLEEASQSAKRFPTLRWVTGQLSDAYAKAGENAKLADLFHEQLSEARKTLSKDSPRLAGLLAQFGKVLLEQKQWTEAEPLLRETVTIREKSQPDSLVHLQHPVDPRRRPAGPEEICRRRAAPPGGLRGNEAAGEDDPGTREDPPARSRRPAHRTLHSDEQAGRSEEVAGRTDEVSGDGPDAGGEEVRAVLVQWP